MRHGTAIEYRQRITRTLVEISEAVEDENDDRLAIDHLARLAHFSRYHFHRIFRGMVGETVSEHARRLRLERAAVHLSQTSDSIGRIAKTAGYASHEAFTRAFTKQFGMTPLKFRSEPFEIPPARCGIRYGSGDAASRFTPVLQENPMVSVSIDTQPARRLVAMRHTGPYSGIGATFERLAGWAGPRGLFGPNTELMVLYHDNPQTTSAEQCRADVGITVVESAEVELTNDVSIVSLPDQECACAVFEGPYERLDEAYAWLYGTWLPDSGRTPADHPSFDIYLNDARTTPPEKLRTLICVPLSTS